MASSKPKFFFLEKEVVEIYLVQGASLSEASYSGYSLIRMQSRVFQNQQNLYPRVPTAVAELLQYSGLGSNTGMGFLRTK